MATQLPLDFKEFLKLLNDKHIEYLLVGGYAVAYYGYPRPTADMDVWVAINAKNAAALVGVLKEFGFNVPQLSAEIFEKENQIVRMGNPPMRLEILTSIDGIRFDQAYERRVMDSIDGQRVNIIGLEDLKRNKAAAGRPKDLDDLLKLVNVPPLA